MDKQRYMISDAAAAVAVESHVLRYWEDELELTIPRNEMGHRYYTKENIDEFLRIKELKEQGYQLKAIKMILHNQNPADLETEDMSEMKKAVVENPNKVVPYEAQYGVNKAEDRIDKQARLEQFEEMMTQIVKKAISENNAALGREVGEEVGVRVLKEMNYLIREQDEQSEERYRRLDEAIRNNYKKKGKEKSGRLFGKKQELKPKQA